MRHATLMLISVLAAGAGCRAMLDLDDNEYTLGEAGGGGSASTASGVLIAAACCGLSACHFMSSRAAATTSPKS